MKSLFLIPTDVSYLDILKQKLQTGSRFLFLVITSSLLLHDETELDSICAEMSHIWWEMMHHYCTESRLNAIILVKIESVTFNQCDRHYRCSSW